VCFDIPVAPIYQCQTGHVMCGKCWKTVRACATCKQPMSNIRSFFIEDIVSRLKLKCENELCTEEVKVGELDVHLVDCDFR